LGSRGHILVGQNEIDITTIMATFVIITILLILLTSPWLLPFLLRIIAQTIGSYFSARCLGRKNLLQSLSESHNLQAAGFSQQAAEDPEWETVERHVGWTAPNGGAEEDGWSGVVGFFHPFW
jgi:hypothetical protein